MLQGEAADKNQPRKSPGGAQTQSIHRSLPVKSGQGDPHSISRQQSSWNTATREASHAQLQSFHGAPSHGGALVARSCPALMTPWTVAWQGLYCPWDSPDKNTGVGCHSLLQGIFPTQGLKLYLLHWQADSLLTEPRG